MCVCGGRDATFSRGLTPPPRPGRVRQVYAGHLDGPVRSLRVLAAGAEAAGLGDAKGRTSGGAVSERG